MFTLSEHEWEELKVVASESRFQKITVSFFEPEKDFTLVLSEHNFRFSADDNPRLVQGIVNEALLDESFCDIRLENFRSDEFWPITPENIHLLFQMVSRGDEI